MKKPVFIRGKADEDIDRAIDYFAREAPHRVDALIASLRSTIESIGQSPGIGSPRFAHELDIPGLRHRAVRRFPYLVFYFEAQDRVDVLRVLHQHRDVGIALLDQE